MKDFEAHNFSPRGIERNAERENRVIYLPNFDTLTISGEQATGKTAVAELLSSSIAGTQFILVGQEVRAEHEDLTAIPDTSNLSYDFGQEEKIRSSKGKPVAIEGRLSGVFAADIDYSLRDEPKSDRPRIVRALITADFDERMRRLVKRGIKTHPEKTPEEIIEEEKGRDNWLVSTARRIYPHLLSGQHPYDSNLRNRAGDKVYNIVLDSTLDPHPEDTARRFLSILEKRGVIKKIQRKSFGKGILGDNAYTSIKAGKPCKIDDCGRLATMTVDSSMAESIYSAPVCSREHAGKIENVIRERIRSIGSNPDEITMGRNGFPPSTQKDTFGVYTLDLDPIPPKNPEE